MPVLLAQSGDRGALNRLLSDVQEDLYSYIVRLVDDKHLAEDILQEVFVLIWLRNELPMNEPTDLDKVRAAALERMERAERSYAIGKTFLITFEATLLACVLITMDYRDRLHWMLLFTALLVYGIWLGGILTLGSYIKYSTQGILKAIDALHHGKEGS
jgi:hypothetical protein